LALSVKPNSTCPPEIGGILGSTRRLKNRRNSDRVILCIQLLLQKSGDVLAVHWLWVMFHREPLEIGSRFKVQRLVGRRHIENRGGVKRNGLHPEKDVFIVIR